MGTIYCIRNKIDGKRYIGSTIQPPQKRWQDHRNTFRGNCHHNSHLQAAWNKYNEQEFEFFVIEDGIPNDILLTREADYMREYNTLDPKYGYNKREELGGGAVRQSEDTIRKRADALRGRPLSEATKKKLSDAKKGQTHTEETKQKMSKTRKGRVFSEEHKKKIADGQKGKIITEDQRRRISATLTGKKQSEETKNKRAESVAKLYIVVFPSKEVFVVKNMARFCRINDELDIKCIHRVVRGIRKSYKGYTARHATAEEESFYAPLLQAVPYIKINT